jgi:mRNA interferase MazF
MRRGEIYWVDFPAPVGRRPAVLVSREESYSVRSRCIVVPLTRTVRGIPTEVRLGPADGLSKAGVANADEIVTIPRTLLRERITALDSSRIVELDRALAFALGLDAP